MEKSIQKFPLNAAQRRVWFAERLRDTGAGYTLDVTARLTGPLDRAALERAFAGLARLHPMTGARFGTAPDGTPVQWTGSEPLPPLLHLTAEGGSTADRRRDALDRARALCARPLTPDGGPLLRAALIGTGPAEHLLTIAYHHLLGDGASSRLLLRDLLRLYTAETDGGAPPAAPGRTFAESVAEEFSPGALAGRRADTGATLRRLTGAPTVSTLPPDRPRPPAATEPGEAAAHPAAAHWIAIDLPPALCSAVAALARAHGTTPFTVHSAALHLLVQRYTGQQDTLVGFMDAARRPAVKDVVGFHARTLVQRLRTTASTTAAEVVTLLHDDIRAALAAGGAPLEELAAAMDPGAAGSRHPLFQTMINLFDLGDRTEAAGMTVEPLVLPAPYSWLDLEIRLHRRSDGGLEGALRCPAERYDAATAERFAHHFTALLGELTDDPAAAVASLPLLDPVERSRVLAAGDGPRSPVEGTLTGRLRAALREVGEPVVTGGGPRPDDADLRRRAWAVAGWLRGRGIGPGDLVAVRVPRSTDLVAALAGVVLAGAAFVPLDPDGPPERDEAILDRLGPAALLLPDGVEPLRAGSAAIGVVERLAAGTTAERTAAVRSDGAVPGPDDLAYVIHTSGSTGAPKAVGITQRAIANRLDWMQAKYPIGPDDAVLQKTPATFDVSVWEFFWPLLHGARSVVARPGGHHDPEYLGSLIRAERVTVAHFVPSMLRAFADVGELERPLPLRHLVCSGEALPPSLVARVTAAGPYRLHNLYGPTEAAVDVTAHTCTPADGKAASVPIGSAAPNTRVRVLDAHGRLQPFGAVGELHLGGVQLARGYLGQPGLTARRFVPDPDAPGERLYRTGDLARLRPDGVLEFLGRTDRQLKLRGFRVEPGEIESALEEVPGVHQAVVRYREEDDGPGRGLVAYYRAAPGLTPEALTAAVAVRLPTHLLPDRYHRVEQVPLLATGKVDHTALARLDTAGGGRAPSPGPLGPAGAALLTVVHAVLGRTDIGPDESFFAVGGDSIRSISLVTAARAAGFGLAVHEVFSHPTARRLAAVARPLAAAADAPRHRPFALVGPQLRAALPDSAVDAHPLSAALGGLLAESHRPERYRVYLTSLRLRGGFDAGRLRRAWETVFARHPVLRSGLWRPGGAAEPVQLVHREVPVPLAVHDLRGSQEPDREARFRDWAEREARTPFDWYRPPLVRLTVHRLTSDEYRLSLAEPWLDGYSAALVLTEILEAWHDPDAEADGPGAPDREIHSHTDVLTRQQEALTGPSRAYWRDALDGAPTSRLPELDGPEGEQPHTAHAERTVRPGTVAALRALNRATGIPLKSMLLAAHVRVLAALTAQAEVTTAVMANVRPETAEGAAAVGLFLNPTPLRALLAPGTWWDLVRQVHAAEVETLPHRAHPYLALVRERIVEPVGTLFNYTHFHPYDRVERSGGPRILERLANDHTYMPLTVQFQLDPLTGRLTLRLEFFGAPVPGARREYLADLYRTAVEHLAAAPHHDHHTDPLLVAGEQPGDRTLTGAAGDRPGLLHEEFARRVERTPGAVAVRSPGGDLTYRELSEAAAELAVALRAEGVGLGETVGVCLPRTPRMPAALLGVLAAGGVHLSLDPALSAVRRAALVAAAGCRVVVVDDATADFAPPGVRRLRIDALPGAPAVPTGVPAPAPARGSDPGPDPDSPAFLVFTSGSTGTPKGVLLSHAAVHNRLRWGLRTLPPAPGELFAARTPTAFVDAIAETLTGLLGGTPTYLVPDTVRDPADLLRLLSAERVTRVTTVPTVLREVLGTTEDLARLLPDLRHWTLSGEVLPTAVALELRRRLPGVRIHNVYGAGEVAADVSAHELDGGESGAAVPIGRPADGCALTVVDAWGNPAPRGTVGEIVVSGAGVALGYLDDPELTAARFVPDRWARSAGLPAGPGARAFRTGDLGRIGPEGGLEYHGRADRQLKVRGIRLEPAEIEEALRLDPRVRDAVVLADPDDTEVRCVAVLVLHPGAGEPEPARLRALVVERIAPAAVPQRFRVAGEVGLTATGKVDRAALWQRASPLGGASAAPGAPPATEVERRLAELWRERLGHSEVARDDDFFEVGGHSLHAVLLAAAVERGLGVRLTLTDVFDHPVLADQARLVESRLG
ncbi:amino acid adenylation domain-containing protein [Kitasatospora sp. NPDC056446]|uniref:amino acid adenylation domain-containing protein n=1 Tax=Kitasatospora sp. NPDC056446 TaxID=3345819 RepID=UPI0036AE2361